MSTVPLSRKIGECVSYLRERGVEAPSVAVVLGSGLSSALPLDDGVTIPYSEIPGFPRGRVDGHECVLEYGKVGGRPVLVLKGRVHHYEGVSLAEATFPVRVAVGLGAPWIALSNACGGIDPGAEVGDVYLITDHNRSYFQVLHRKLKWGERGG